MVSCLLPTQQTISSELVCSCWSIVPNESVFLSAPSTFLRRLILFALFSIKLLVLLWLLLSRLLLARPTRSPKHFPETPDYSSACFSSNSGCCYFYSIFFLNYCSYLQCMYFLRPPYIQIDENFWVFILMLCLWVGVFVYGFWYFRWALFKKNFFHSILQVEISLIITYDKRSLITNSCTYLMRCRPYWW